MIPRALLLRASLLAIAAPLAGCGGSTTSDTGASGSTGGTSAGGTSSAGGSGNATGGGTGTGAGGTASGGSGVAGAGPGPSTAFPCADPHPVIVKGIDTGYDLCAAGQTRRRAIVTCPSLLPRPATCATSGTDQCKADADCNAMPDGHCDPISGFAPPGCVCTYGCTADSDCATGSICECADPVGTCVPATCKSDADCPGGPCSTYATNPGCPGLEFACQSAGDQCGGDKDCTQAGALCTVALDPGATTRVCHTPQCAVGRPLTIDHAPRLAGLTMRRDWALSAISHQPSAIRWMTAAGCRL